jgi:general stress protein 26
MEGATAPEWAAVDTALTEAGIYWLTTVRADGRPHLTPLIGAWLDGIFYFGTGAAEQKAVNLNGNNHVVVSTGNNDYFNGFDVVIEGDAVRATDQSLLELIAATFKSKYDWDFEPRDGALYEPADGAHSALVFAVAPKKVLGFVRGEIYSQTRWTFA